MVDEYISKGGIYNSETVRIVIFDVYYYFTSNFHRKFA